MYCVGQGSGLARCCAGKRRFGRKLSGRTRRWRSMGEDAARFQGFGGCFCGGGACRFGVHEDGWMRWVAVEPCHLELRVSRIPIPHSPFSIWLTYGHWAQGVTRSEGQTQIQEATSYFTNHRGFLLPTVHPTLTRLAQIDFCPGLPRTQQQVPIQSPGPTTKANQARQPRPKTFLAAWDPVMSRPARPPEAYPSTDTEADQKSKPLTPRVRLFWIGEHRSLVPMTRLALIAKTLK